MGTRKGAYGLWLKVKGPNGKPIRTEKWFENRSDRERDLRTFPERFGKRLLGSGRLGKG